MFSNALKSLYATNITSHYTLAATPTGQAGPWTVYDATHKSSGRAYSVFVFDRKAVEAHMRKQSSLSSTSGAPTTAAALDEVVAQLKREAASLARLRHPNVLELVEPVEDTRGGGVQFVTEPVVASLAELLQDKDDEERWTRSSAPSRSRPASRKDIELDELEMQKGLLQVGKALAFLHDHAGLVHGNLTPDAILVNAKSDWKVAGFRFSFPVDPTKASSSSSTAASPGSRPPPLRLADVLDMDPRLLPSLRLHLDYTSPDFILDQNVTPAADMFSLGLLILSLYNSPHVSPLATHGHVSQYKRLVSSPVTMPSAANRFLATDQALPAELQSQVLPRLITRRPVQRMTASEFQESAYFDNVLVSTIRFLDAFPAKTVGEKTSFLKGLHRMLPSFPKSVMEKKILPALLEELKDKSLAALLLQDIFALLELLPAAVASRAFAARVRKRLREVVSITVVPKTAAGTATTNGGTATPRNAAKDPARDAALMTILAHLGLICRQVSAAEFREDILPIYLGAIGATTPLVLDTALQKLHAILDILDFVTVKSEVFPAIASMFGRTTSLAIKVRGLQAFAVLCGDRPSADGLGGEAEAGVKHGVLDKFSMQESVVPLLRGIRTKEPAVMMAALPVLRAVGEAVDAEFVALDLLPLVWSMSLGPLLSQAQFQQFMQLVRHLSTRVEEAQMRKLQDLSGSDATATAATTTTTTTTSASSSSSLDLLGAAGGLAGTPFDATSGATEDDFARLVRGHSLPSTGTATTTSSSNHAATTTTSHRTTTGDEMFGWSTRSVTPDSSRGRGSPVTSNMASLASVNPWAQPPQHSPLTSFSQTPPAQTQSQPWTQSQSQSQSQPQSFSLSPPPSSGYGSAGPGTSTPLSLSSLSLSRPSQSTPSNPYTSSLSSNQYTSSLASLSNPAGPPGAPSMASLAAASNAAFASSTPTMGQGHAQGTAKNALPPGMNLQLGIRRPNAPSSSSSTFGPDDSLI